MNHAPVAIPDLAGVASMSAGDSGSCAVLTGGGAKCWGDNQLGDLGTDTTGPPSAPVTAMLTGVVEIAVGYSAACARTVDATVRCWGYAATSGEPTLPADSKLPSTTGLANIVAITNRNGHACALDASGAVFCWGSNNDGQLGTGDRLERGAPTRVAGLSAAIALGGGTLHTCAVLTDHTVRCWGQNAFGALGTGSVSVMDVTAPVAVRTGP
jgi:alpha-tubulin suppressor-like RCC1 family protein